MGDHVVGMRPLSVATILSTLAIFACTTSGAPPIGAPQSNTGGVKSQIRHADPFATNLILNGSFEKPVVPVGGFEDFSKGMTFPHWTVVGASGNVSLVSGSFTQNGILFPSKCGQQWLDLTGISQTATGVKQSVATQPGSQHTLTFAVGNVSDPGGIFGTTSTVKVFVNGTKIFTAINSNGSGQNKMVWKTFTAPVSATTSTTSITFINGDPSTDTANGLDCVKLT